MGALQEHTWQNANQIGLSPRCHEFWRYQPTLYQYGNGRSAGSGLFGQDVYSSGVQLSQLDTTFLNFIMISNPEAKHFVELGTGGGTTAVYMGIAAKMRGGKLTTIDNQDTRTAQAKAVWQDDYMLREYVDFSASSQSEDCHQFQCTPKTKDVVNQLENTDIWLVHNHSLRDKIVYMYAKSAPVGAICVVHGLTMDNRLYDIFNSTFQYYGYQQVFREFAESVGTNLRAWRRVTIELNSEFLRKIQNKREPYRPGAVQ